MPRSFDVSAESSASVEQLFAAFSRKDYWLDRIAVGAATTTLDSIIIDADGTVTVCTTQHVGRQLLPGKVAKLLPTELKIVQNETWRPDGDHQLCGQLDVSVSGGLGSASAQTWLAPVGSGSQMRFSVQVQVKIPVVGGKLEKSIGGGLANSLAAMLDFTADWIAEHP